MTALPPGQRLIAGFPRFGVSVSRPPPPVPPEPVLALRGELLAPFDLPVESLADLPRLEIVADFHCVAGWSARDLRWEGVAFADFYRLVLAPAVPVGAQISHVSFDGADGWRSVLLLEDAMAPRVLLAQRLGGRPLDGDHGAPLRLVSPDQYGYASTKHLRRIGLHVGAPVDRPKALTRRLLRRLLSPHPRARVWREERHRQLPAWVVRRAYRATVAPTIARSARGARADDDPGGRTPSG